MLPWGEDADCSCLITSQSDLHYMKCQNRPQQSAGQLDSPLQRDKAKHRAFNRFMWKGEKHCRCPRPRRQWERQYNKGSAVQKVGHPGRASIQPWVSNASRPACCRCSRRTLLDFIHTVIVSQLCHIRETYCKTTVSNSIRTNLGVRLHILLWLFKIFFQTWISGTFYFLSERKMRNRPRNARKWRWF